MLGYRLRILKVSQETNQKTIKIIQVRDENRLDQVVVEVVRGGQIQILGVF